MTPDPQRWRVKRVVEQLVRGAVIAYPTEGVWGLGCVPENEQGVARILRLKQRSWEQGLILAAGNMQQLASYLGAISEAERATLEAAWPGPVTFIVPDNGTAPAWIRGRHDTLAVRVSAHPVVAALCNELGGPLVSTSANPSGRSPARTALRVRQYFPEGIDTIFPGNLGANQGATEIRLLRSGEILRKATPGPVL